MAKFEMTAVQYKALECYAKVAHMCEAERRKNRRAGTIEYRLSYCLDHDEFMWEVFVVNNNEERYCEFIGFLAGLEILSAERYWSAFGRMPSRFARSVIGIMRYYHLLDDEDMKEITDDYFHEIEIVQEV